MRINPWLGGFALTLMASTWCWPAGAGTVAPIDTSVAVAAKRVQVSQVLHNLAQSANAGKFAEASNLFSASAKLSLHFNDTSKSPPELAATGYSASSTPTGGTASGGCVAAGRTAIANFLQGLAPTYGPASPTRWPSKFRSHVINTLVTLDQNGSMAEARTYLLNYTDNSQNGTQLPSGQAWAKFDKTSDSQWQISELRIVFDTAQPNYPCQN